jgi:hypothetical protein
MSYLTTTDKYVGIDGRSRKNITYRPFQSRGCKKGLFPTRPFSFSLKIGMMRVFSKKQRSLFLFRPKNLPQKKLQGYQLFDFPRFLNNTFYNLTSFWCRNLCLDALERYFIEQNSKKTTTANIFF